MDDYLPLLQRHLAVYKTTRLGIDQPGIFRHQGRHLTYDHILPTELRWLNLLETFRAEIRQYVETRPSLQLHKFFHHLNSSQAFALNLFFPFIETAQSSSLLRALGCPGDCIAWEAEYVADAVEGTNVDVTWIGSNGGRTVCEGKLSEQEFGTAAGDDRHQRKLDEIYAPVLSNHCSADLLQAPVFFIRYQILRNV